jgi:hypothetical protein
MGKNAGKAKTWAFPCSSVVLTCPVHRYVNELAQTLSQIQYMLQNEIQTEIILWLISTWLATKAVSDVSQSHPCQSPDVIHDLKTN